MAGRTLNRRLARAGRSSGAIADLLAKKKGFYFLQIVKEPIPDLVPANEALE